MRIFGVMLDNLPLQKIHERLSEVLLFREDALVVTLNPEILLLARRDPLYATALNAAAIRTVDGFGIVIVGFFRWKKLLCRCTGVEAALEVLTIADNKNLSVCLVGSSRGLSSSQETAAVLQRRFPRAMFSTLSCDVLSARQTAQAKTSLERSKPDIILCNFGAPYQELFLSSLESGSSRVMMGVGGAFDMWTGKTPRAPRWMRRVGMEWLWRLILQPKRLYRIGRAVFVFPWLAFRDTKNKA